MSKTKDAAIDAASANPQQPRIRSFHVRMCIESALGKTDHMIESFGFTDQHGNALDADQAREALRLALASGKKYIPMGDGCDNWCDQRGCLGHDEPGEAAEQAAKKGTQQ